MKLLVPIAAIIAAAAAGHVYTSQPAESYAQSAELYQSQLEHQQQGLYSDQSQTLTDHGAHQSRSGEKNARILSFVSEKDGHGYQYAYETENGIKAQESGQTHGGTVAQGAYSYTGDDGHVYTVTYIADEHGFRAQGGHLPTPPPMSEEIAKSLEQNAKDEAAGIFDDGKYVEVHEKQHSQQAQQHQLASQGFLPQQQEHQLASQGFLPQQQEHQLASQGFQPQHQLASHGFQPLEQEHQLASHGFQSHQQEHQPSIQSIQPLQQQHQLASQGFQPIQPDHQLASQGFQAHQNEHQPAIQSFQPLQQQHQHYEAPTFHKDAYSAHLTPPSEGSYHKH